MFRISTITGFLLALLFFSYASEAQTQTINKKEFTIKKSGDDRPMLLIPGLSSSRDVWNKTVNHFKDNFECQAFTLAGFAGKPPIDTDDYLKTIKNGIIDYMDKNLDEPAVLIGHSLGGFLVYWIGSDRPDLVKAAISVDGPPWLGGVMLGDMDKETRQSAINQMISGMKNASDKEFKARQSKSFSSMIRNQDTAAAYSKWGKTSDQHTVTQAMGELMKTSLADSLKTMTVPTLHLFAVKPYKAYGATRESILKVLKKQTKLHPNITFQSNPDANHFMMTDEPEWFFQTVGKFLKPILQD